MVKSALLFAAVASVVNAQTEIINGTVAPIGKHLHTTGFRTTDVGGNVFGGALIAPKYVLTTASGSDRAFSFSSVGSHYLSGNKDGERIKIVKKTVHPKYNSNTYEFDFAVVELETASKVAPVKVNFDPVVAPGTKSWVRGWGRFDDTGNYSPVLLEGELPVWEQEACVKALKPWGTVYASHICAGGADKDWCAGDAGAPLTIVKDGQEILVGLASYGGEAADCAAKGVPGVYARTSSGRDFIESFLPGKALLRVVFGRVSRALTKKRKIGGFARVITLIEL